MANLMKQAHCWEVVASRHGVIRIEQEHTTLLQAEEHARSLFRSGAYSPVSLYLIRDGEVSLDRRWKH